MVTAQDFWPLVDLRSVSTDICGLVFVVSGLFSEGVSTWTLEELL